HTARPAHHLVSRSWRTIPPPSVISVSRWGVPCVNSWSSSARCSCGLAGNCCPRWRHWRGCWRRGGGCGRASGPGAGGGGGGGAGGGESVAAAAAVELLHASALVHDDVIDGSDTRRGRPSLHRRFAARHAGQRWHGSPERFGMGAAILMGDLLLSWTDAMYHGSARPDGALRRGQTVLDLMRTEVIAGQYLDLLSQARGNETVQSALRVVEYKTAKYTIERPLHLGAALAGFPDGPVPAALTAYGLPLGVAFQLRDAILGGFGDPAQPGKPAGDDVREGKRTVLLAIARSRAGAAQARIIDERLGDPRLDAAGVAEVRAVIIDTGALAACEAMIGEHVAKAVTALGQAPVTDQAKAALAELAVTATA